MITESELTSAQKYLWVRAQEEMEDHSFSDVLFLVHSLLRSAPEFLAARRLARKAALRLVRAKKKQVLRSLFRSFVVRVTVAIMRKQKRYNEALVALERFLAVAPDDLHAHRLMATIAEQSDPPLLSLALFALETALVIHTSSIPLHLEIARVSLLVNQHKCPWNLPRAIEAYQQLLALAPHHLEARQGLKNASALLSMQESMQDDS